MQTASDRTVDYIDPINGKMIVVQSVYRPVHTLLQGRPYSRHPVVLTTQREKEMLQWPTILTK